MTPNESATARSRRFIRILGWVAAPVGAITLITGIIESVTGTGVGWLSIVLGVVLLGLGVLLIWVSTVRHGTSPRA